MLNRRIRTAPRQQQKISDSRVKSNDFCRVKHATNFQPQKCY